MKKHTSEPWFIDGQCAAAESDQVNNGFYTAICKGPDGEANARRIVACVNFCAGISTENLEVNEKLLWLAEQYNALKYQSGALSLALEEARTGLVWYQEHCPSNSNGSDDKALARIDAALELAKGSL